MSLIEMSNVIETPCATCEPDWKERLQHYSKKLAQVQEAISHLLYAPLDTYEVLKEFHTVIGAFRVQEARIEQQIVQCIDKIDKIAKEETLE